MNIGEFFNKLLSGFTGRTTGNQQTSTGWTTYNPANLPKMSNNYLPSQAQPVRNSGNSINVQRLLSSENQRAFNQRAVQYLPLFSYYSSLYRIPYGLLQSIAEKESGMQNGKRSFAGARGLMGIMPSHYNGTYARVWRSQGTPPPNNSFNPDDVNKAIHHAAWYLRTILFPRFGNWAQAIAAYNQGETAVARATRHGTSWKNQLPTETKDYVAYITAKTGLT